MRYAGFWPRLGAMLVDTIVVAPLMWLAYWSFNASHAWALVVQVVSIPLYAGYNIYFVGRWGQTIGKMVLHIKVVKLDGSGAGFGRAFYRHSVDLAFSILSGVVTVNALLSIPGPAYDALSFDDKIQLFDTRAPSWSRVIDVLSFIWIVSELAVLLLNEKRRALHDFIAGTVVVHEQREIVVEA